VYAITGLSTEQVTDIVARVAALLNERRGWQGNNFKLGLFKRVVITLVYLRRNHREAELGELYDIDQSTVSRYVCALTPVIGQVLSEFVPTVDDLDPDVPYVIDGTLCPCWSWAGHDELWSGKHSTTGKNVQVACYLDGTMAWVGDPEDGNVHDATAVARSGFLEGMNAGVVADKGYIGTGAITPKKRRPGQAELSEQDKDYNRSVGQIRWVIERANSWLKNWNILQTDYRRPLSTFDQTIATVIALQFYKTAQDQAA